MMLRLPRPLLEFSSVLSDDDLIELIESQTEGHRFAIAGRSPVADRVSSSICHHSDKDTISKLIDNEDAIIGPETGPVLIKRAAEDPSIAGKMGTRKDVDWRSIYAKLDDASKRVFANLARNHMKVDKASVDAAKEIVAHKLQQRSGFKATEWTVAWGRCVHCVIAVNWICARLNVFAASLMGIMQRPLSLDATHSA